MGNEISTCQMQLSRKIQANNTLKGTVLENVESIKCLDVTTTNDLKWIPIFPMFVQKQTEFSDS